MKNRISRDAGPGRILAAVLLLGGIAHALPGSAEPVPTPAPQVDAPAADTGSPDGAAAAAATPAATPTTGADRLPEPAREPFAQVRLQAEVGMLAPLKHTIQAGKDGTRFDYIRDGGQDNLFLAWRLSAELKLAARHSLIFLYQPIDLRTTITADRDLRFDDTVFPAGTPVDLQYGFPFYRFSYMYDFLEGPRADVSLGLSLQIRNATIVFTAADGSGRTARRDIGLVPLIKLAGQYRWDNGVFLGGEVDGIWAPIRYLNGGDSDVEGAFIDLSARAGYRVLPGTDLFVNVRYLGGGAGGTGDGGFTDNWLHFLTATVGVQIDFQDLVRRWPSFR